MAAIKTILVPTDFSKFSDNALKQAVEMAEQNKADLSSPCYRGSANMCN